MTPYTPIEASARDSTPKKTGEIRDETLVADVAIDIICELSASGTGMVASRLHTVWRGAHGQSNSHGLH